MLRRVATINRCYKGLRQGALKGLDVGVKVVLTRLVTFGRRLTQSWQWVVSVKVHAMIHQSIGLGGLI